MFTSFDKQTWQADRNNASTGNRHKASTGHLGAYFHDKLNLGFDHCVASYLMQAFFMEGATLLPPGIWPYLILI